jgi:hypothetical protein
VRENIFDMIDQILEGNLQRGKGKDENWGVGFGVERG